MRRSSRMLAEFPTKTCSVGMVLLEVIWPSSSLFYSTGVLWSWTDFSWMNEELAFMFYLLFVRQTTYFSFLSVLCGYKIYACLHVTELFFGKKLNYEKWDVIYVTVQYIFPRRTLIHCLTLCSLPWYYRHYWHILIYTIRFVRYVDVGG
jgi:hypothetical protein